MGEGNLKRPESVLVLVYTRRGEVLLLRRRRPRWFWQSVTGSLKWGERAEAAARRELGEETGLRGGCRLLPCRHEERFPIMGPWRARYGPNVRFNREHWFRLALSGRRSIRLNSREHTEYRWLPAREAAARASSWTNRKAIRRILGPYASP